MKPRIIEDRIAQQPWVPPMERALTSLSEATVKNAGRLIKNFLHGTWLKHPLHAASVEVPIGALTAATVLDVLGEAQGTRKYEPGADAALGLGLITASFAALSGMADWSHTDRPADHAARRVGVLHATCNGSATVAYLAALILRKNGQRPASVGVGILGWSLLAVGAFLGGRLAYNHRLGMDHAEREGPLEFTPIFPESELPENHPHKVEIEGTSILVVKQNGEIFALGDRCAHRGGPLSEGELGEGTITCPWHGSTFCLKSGAVHEGPSPYPQATFETRVRGGQVEVRLSRKT